MKTRAKQELADIAAALVTVLIALGLLILALPARSLGSADPRDRNHETQRQR